ncbi:MAG: hypothetical protein WD749_14910 [Phycisphaerales bacterium]
MVSRTTAGFRRQFGLLPREVQSQARAAFAVFKADPHHPRLHFKKLPPHEDLWSARINRDYRVIGRWRGGVILWFFIGSHADYEAAIRRY